ncbi:MAG: PAAR domain-containing protein [Polyangiaceae bacterium]
MPPAARITDMHTCPMVNPGPVPHVGGPKVSGSHNVITGYMPQGRVGDTLICVPATDKVAMGSPTVIVNNKQAARLGDPTAHGGKLVSGCPTVIIGESGQGSTLRGAAADGTPFCEECERLKKQQEQAALEQAPPHNNPPPDSTVWDPKTPPPLPPYLQARNITPSTVELAKKPGSSRRQIAARYKVAEAFYSEHGMTWDAQEGCMRKMHPWEIPSHLKGIDFKQPVEFGPPPDMPSSITQWQKPWQVHPGDYYAAAGTKPTNLGISDKCANEGGPEVAKVARTYDVHSSSPYLKTTAAKIDDHWSVPGAKHPTDGGATQYYMPLKTPYVKLAGGSP